MTKTMSIRMDEDNFEFLNRLSKEEKGDVSKAVRELVCKGRVMLAVERYKKAEVSLGFHKGDVPPVLLISTDTGPIG